MDIIYSVVIIAIVIGIIIRAIYKVVSGNANEVLEALFAKTEATIKYVMIFLGATVLTALGGKITWLSAIITVILAGAVAIILNIFKEYDSVTVKLIVYGICVAIIAYLTFCSLFVWFMIGWGTENINLIGILF